MTVTWSIEAPCHENQVMPSRIRSYCRQYVPADGGAVTVADSPVTVPPVATSCVIGVCVPFHTAVLVPEQLPFRQWYASLTLFGAVADHVSVPMFVNETETTLAEPAVIDTGVVCAPQLTP